MDAHEMVKFFAWIERYYGPEELLELPDNTPEFIQGMIDKFRGVEQEAEE